MKRLELTGQTFYKVAVLGFSYCKNQKTYWKCKCACGNIFDSRGDTIKRGEVRSCKKGSCHPGSIKTGEASFNHIYRIYQQSATIKNLSFSLTKEQFRKIISRNCYYCNKIPSNRMDSKKQKYNGDLIYSGIDRKDNNKGYHIDNCLPCCKRCNFLKKDTSYIKFLQTINDIYNNLEGEINEIFVLSK